MRKAPSAVLLASIALCALFFIPQMVRAANACDTTPLAASGYFFTAHDDPQYSSEGRLEYHLRISSSWTDGRPFRLSWTYLSDECGNAGNSSVQKILSLPVGVTDWSVRFSSQTHFDVWDDQNGVIITGFDIPPYPNYTSVTFSASIDGSGSTLYSRRLQINQNGEAPSFSGTLPFPESCVGLVGEGAAGGSNPYFFDSYEHAEYMDGLLRVHMRLKTPYNDGRTFNSRVSAAGENCASSFPSPSTLNTAFTPHIRYYSFRMTSVTHWQLWDDENNQALACTACAGDIAPGSAYVVWYTRIDGGASTIRTTPFSPTEPITGCTENCNSSILFLPGIQGSRLYEGAEKLWEPLGDEDMQALYLNDEGNSEHADVYTTEVIDTVPITGNRIYESFLNDLAQMEADEVIADYAAVPYDWRLALPDILASGKEEAGGQIFYNRATSTPYIEQTLRHLAEDSRTEKVTIVAHSNGGLLAKALLNQLGADASELVDQVIFVGVPQLGTPQAIGALLHGFETGIPFDWLPFLVSPERARDFALDAPMAY